MEKDGTLVRIVDNPQSQSLDAGYVFVPLKVTVDYADRIYCIAQNMFEGIMVFETNGEFSGFFGTIDVKITLWEKFWKRIATQGGALQAAALYSYRVHGNRRRCGRLHICDQH